MISLGLIREYKQPPDRRVAFTPQQCHQIKTSFLDSNVVVESSPDRIFNDDSFKKEGIEITNDLSNCDILFGIKEVPVDKLIEDKTYLFFSHIIKNRPITAKC